MRHENATAHQTDRTYDVAIIGTGVVGCAMARRFALEGASVAVLEKAPDILDGASKANSAILHTGFDAPFGSLELECIKAGYEEYREIHEHVNLPVMKTGAIVVAWNAEEEARLADLMDQARANGVDDIEPLTAQQIADREPNLSSEAVAGFLVPREYVIDPWTTPHTYLMQAIENGATVLRECEVTGGVFSGSCWTLETGSGTICANAVINCAGLYGDQIDAALLGDCSFRIKPRKGQFLVFDKSAFDLVSAIILPVPGKTTKGVVVCRTIFGNLLVGPTAEEQDSRLDASVQADTLRFLHDRAEQILPGISKHVVTATYAGLRPATENKDYQITHHPGNNYTSVGGIRSTGLSAALGIASYVFNKHAISNEKPRTKHASDSPKLTQIAETVPRDWSKPGNGGIVCHCELVTRREVEQALEGPLAARSLAGLKRRTRVTMGRCQGFYCSAELSELTAGKFSEPLASGNRDDG